VAQKAVYTFHARARARSLARRGEGEGKGKARAQQQPRTLCFPPPGPSSVIPFASFSLNLIHSAPLHHEESTDFASFWHLSAGMGCGVVFLV